MAKDLATYADKAPSSLHTEFAAWIEDNTGVKVDVDSVRLAITLIPTYQRSPENKARNARIKSERQAALKAKAEKAKEAKAAAPKAAAKKTAAAPAAKATAVSGAKKAPAKKPVAKKTAVKATEAAF